MKFSASLRGRLGERLVPGSPNTSLTSIGSGAARGCQASNNRRLEVVLFEASQVCIEELGVEG